MPRCAVTCVWPGGESFHCTASEAQRIVADGEGEWEGEQNIRMNGSASGGGRLSLRVGARLAGAVRRREGWAKVMLSEINR
jgi:hypothetical protein